MKTIVFIFLILLTSCGGSLSDEQRKKLKEGIRQHEITKVSDAQVTEGGFSMGRMLVKRIGKNMPNKNPAIESLQKEFKIKIFLLHPAD